MKAKGWKLPAAFLLGYITAWGTILIDRQMVIDEQHQIQQEVERMRKEIRISDMVDQYNQEFSKTIEWNKQSIVPEEQSGETK